MAKPINNIIKERFQSLFKTAEENAAKDYKINIESKLEGLDHFNQLKLLAVEVKKIEAKIDASEFPFYIQHFSSEEWLLNQFASRTFLLNVDESEPLSDSVYLGCYRAFVIDKELNLKKQIPVY